MKERRKILTILATANIGGVAGCLSFRNEKNSTEKQSADQDTTSVDSSQSTSTQTATLTPTQQNTATPTDSPTSTPTDSPTSTPTDSPTSTPTDSPTSTGPDKLFPDDYENGFGGSVGVAADRSITIIGGYNDENQNGSSAGSAYVFIREGGEWQQQNKLVAGDGDTEDQFGYSVGMAADGSTAVIGTFGDEDPNQTEAGSAYVFTQAGGEWQQQAKLVPDDSEIGFGRHIGITADGSTAVVGAFGDDANGNREISAYVFTQAGGGWQQQAKLVPGDSEDRVASVEVAADGSTVVIGALGDENPNGSNAGSAYVFTQAGGGWQQQAKLVPDDGDSDDLFGISMGVAADGATAVIGASDDEDPNGPDAGSAYVFTRSDGEWQQQTKIIPGDGDARDKFGASVGLGANGKIAVIGAERDGDPNGGYAPGSAYVFTRTDGEWQQQEKLISPDAGSEELFGDSVGVGEDASTVIVGAPRASSAYVFSLD